MSASVASVASMQQPTLTNIRIRSVEDAHIILYAAHRGWLNVITRRLDVDEKQALRPGDVYVWIEGNSQTDVTGLGIMRWTDGRKWSQSRTRDEFLYYEEEDPNGGAPPRPDRMVKQTYSATATATDYRGSYRICLHTYYTDNSLRLLGTIDSIPELRGLQVPRGLFTRIKKTSRKSRGRPLPAETQDTSPPHSYDIVDDINMASSTRLPGILDSNLALYGSALVRSPSPEFKDRRAASFGSARSSHGPYETTSHGVLHQGFPSLDLVTPDYKPGNAPHLSFAGNPVRVHTLPRHSHLPIDPFEPSAPSGRYVIVSPNSSDADHSASHFISDALGAQAMHSSGAMDSNIMREPPRMTSFVSSTSSGWPAALESPGALAPCVPVRLTPFEQLRKDRTYPRSPIDDGHLKLLSNIAGYV